ncbi:MAG: sulfur carrier protein ThiS, partial [Gammaproteobacteria bacterium]
MLKTADGLKTAESVEIHVNGQLQCVDSQWTLKDLIVAMGLANQRIAIEINGRIVPRSLFEQTQITP